MWTETLVCAAKDVSEIFEMFLNIHTSPYSVYGGRVWGKHKILSSYTQTNSISGAYMRMQKFLVVTSNHNDRQSRVNISQVTFMFVWESVCWSIDSKKFFFNTNYIISSYMIHAQLCSVHIGWFQGCLFLLLLHIEYYLLMNRIVKLCGTREKRRKASMLIVTKTSTSSLEYRKQSENICGRLESSHTMADDQSITKGTWPWSVAIYKKRNDGVDFQCTSKMVNNKFVLTAVCCSCLNPKRKPGDVLLGIWRHIRMTIFKLTHVKAIGFLGAHRMWDRFMQTWCCCIDYIPQAIYAVSWPDRTIIIEQIWPGYICGIHRCY